MKTKTCPMCQGERFFTSTFVPMENFLLAVSKMVGVYPSVCLSCGFVAPSVDHDGLVAIREKARKEGMVIDEKSGKEELREL